MDRRQDCRCRRCAGVRRQLHVDPQQRSLSHRACSERLGQAIEPAAHSLVENMRVDHHRNEHVSVEEPRHQLRSASVSIAATSSDVNGSRPFEIGNPRSLRRNAAACSEIPAPSARSCAARKSINSFFSSNGSASAAASISASVLMAHSIASAEKDGKKRLGYASRSESAGISTRLRLRVAPISRGRRCVNLARLRLRPRHLETANGRESTRINNDFSLPIRVHWRPLAVSENLICSSAREAAPNLMKAVRLVQPGRPLELQDVPIPQAAADVVLVWVKAAGICHSDGALSCGNIARSSVALTLGHEVAGVVEADRRECETSGHRPARLPARPGHVRRLRAGARNGTNNFARPAR